MALMFQRLARNFAANGYYPTDESTIERILSMLRPSPQGTMKLIDPCAGEGVALAECKHHLGADRAEAFGVELHKERAWNAKEILDRVIHGDFQETTISYRRFGLLWFNPPYGDLVSDQAAMGDPDGKGRQRLEKLFYHRAYRLLQPGGVMVLIVPHYSIDKEYAGWIAGHFERVEAFLSPEQRFKQAVVVGVRANAWQSGDAAKRVRLRLERLSRGEADTLPESWDGEPYEIPEDKGAGGGIHRQASGPKPCLRRKSAAIPACGRNLNCTWAGWANPSAGPCGRCPVGIWPCPLRLGKCPGWFAPTTAAGCTWSKATPSRAKP